MIRDVSAQGISASGGHRVYQLAVADDGMVWEFMQPGFSAAVLGFLPEFFTVRDARPAREQIAERYGWSPIPGMTLHDGPGMHNVLTYPGDPPFMVVAQARLRNELLAFYLPGTLLAIIQPDRSFEVSRVD